MRDADIARRLLLAFGAIRFIVLGALSGSARNLLRDAGCDVLLEDNCFETDASRKAFEEAGKPELLARSCLVCLNLSDEALTAALSSETSRRMRGAYIQHLASPTLDRVETVEQCAFGLGYRKHPAYHRLFGYAELERNSLEIATLLEPVPALVSARFPMERLLEERDLHMDMLREAGRRADAHVARYDWASGFIRPHDVVLDAACGLGYGTHVMRRLSPASRFYGIDGSEWAVDYATASFASHSAEFFPGLLPDVLSRFGDASVDVIVSFETLEHVGKPDMLLDAFWRVLRPGGRLIVSVPNDWSDETGYDPNPEHLHVYTFERLSRELAAGFTIERVERQIASGCKRLDAHCQWVERPRVLETVEPADARRKEAEWWLVVAMKSPETGRSLIYRETVHGCFLGATHLVDFEGHYVNPWLVHAMIEIPFRLQRTEELKRLAGHVLAEYPRESADRGAALAVICYRALEEHAEDGQLVQLDTQIADYLAQASSNPHTRRWQISLTYARARLRLRRGNRSGALADFMAVADAEVVSITPTLGTKTIDAAFWAGTLSWIGGDKAGGRGWWRHGLQAAGQLVGSEWPEFIGNSEAPFVFAMNDAAEIVDRATACAEALALTHRCDENCEAYLEQIGRKSLRSALRQLSADLVAARADAFALGEEFQRVCNELAAQSVQKTALEQAATERLGCIHRLEAELSTTQTDFSAAEKTANARLDQAHSALEETKALSVDRLKHIHALEARLCDTDAALNEVKAQAVLRLREKMELEERIRQTDAALEEARELAVSRLNRIAALEQELRIVQAAAVEPATTVPSNPSSPHNVDADSAR